MEEELDLVPYMPDVMRTITQLFAAQYLMAAELMCTVGKIDIRRHLDRLNPNRRPMDNLLRSASYMANESANGYYLIRTATSWDYPLAILSPTWLRTTTTTHWIVRRPSQVG